MQAAETITGAGLDTLDRLLAKSLLVRRRERWAHPAGDAGNGQRLRRRTLRRGPDRDSIRERHSTTSGPWLAATGPIIRYGRDRGEHLAALDGETENLRAALHRAVERNATGQALEMSAALIDYWMMRDRFTEALHSVELRCRIQPHWRPGGTRPRALQDVLALMGGGASG